MTSRAWAPARRYWRPAGAAVFLVVALACGEGGAASDEGPRVLELRNDTIALADGERLVDVAVKRQTPGEFDPPAIQANVGDFVRFTALDRGGHALVFDGAALTDTARAYLSASGQLRSPPLITDSAAWVLSLKDAPPGEYPFRCTTHAALGKLTVRAKVP